MSLNIWEEENRYQTRGLSLLWTFQKNSYGCFKTKPLFYFARFFLSCIKVKVVFVIFYYLSIIVYYIYIQVQLNILFWLHYCNLFFHFYVTFDKDIVRLFSTIKFIKLKLVFLFNGRKIETIQFIKWPECILFIKHREDNGFQEKITLIFFCFN